MPALARKAVEYLGQRASAAKRGQPLFLYLPLNAPHTPIAPTTEWQGKSGLNPYADFVMAVDAEVGRIMAAMERTSLAENTLLIFTSDNGPHRESNHDLARFQSSGPLRGTKRSLTDGGIRVPMIAWWPGQVKPGSKSGHVGYSGDWMATAAELAGATVPEGCDSLSFAPTLLGQETKQRRHEFLYWEFHERGFQQAVRMGNWKAVRLKPGAPLELFDLANDPAEAKDVAASNPAVIAAIEPAPQARLVIHQGDVERQLPVADEFLVEVDLDGRRVVVEPPEGLPEERRRS